MKYIIDVPNNGYVSKEDGCLYIPLRSDGCDPLMVNPTWLLTGYHAEPYIEPDREAIENEVWSIAREIAYFMSLAECEEAGMLCDDDIYESATGVLEKLSYQEAKAKYDAWKKRKDEIHVGDEVKYSLAGYEYTFIVLGKENDTLYGIRSDCKDGLDDVYDGWDTCNKSDHTLVKTGRHFDEVEKLLERMKAE